MVIKTADGWILDVTQDYGTGDINLLIKLQNSNVMTFRQRLKEYAFYIQPKSQSAGEDLFQQLSRSDEIIKKIFWDEKYTDLADKNKTRLIGISVTGISSQDYQKFIKKLGTDSRVCSLFNTELSVIQQFIYNQLKIAPTCKVRIEYDEKELLTISKVDDSQDIVPPPFKIMHIRVGDDNKNDEITFKIRLENGSSVVFNGLSYESFISYVKENEPDIAIIYEEYQYDYDIVSSIDSIITKYCNQTVVIHSRDIVDDISFVEMVEKARFSYLPLKLASKYRMLRLIDSRITYELLKRDFVVPKTAVNIKTSRAD